ncbi:MAG: site-2 protease family protein [Acidobacteria bacterium]|nr:site-2 protease family protein [Acidobacteriota bacterium]
MTLEHVDILFQLIVFLFAISIHEAAHAWMANRCGDPTARMLGRITLNPIKHIDLVGTILLPMIAKFAHFPAIGWAKPTPVDPRNFRNHVLDDVLTSIAGPITNFLVASAAVLLLITIALTSNLGHQIVRSLPLAYRLGMVGMGSDSVLVPVCLLLYQAMMINVVLGVFNLIPVPPLDGSHVLRHFLSDSLRRVYDTIGVFGLIALVFLGGGLLARLFSPVVNIFDSILTRF